MAAAGYPSAPRSGAVIHGVEDAEANGVAVLHAGTTAGPDGLAVSGGRVLGVTATGETLGAARDLAYAGVEAISFDGAQLPRHRPSRLAITPPTRQVLRPDSPGLAC